MYTGFHVQLAYCSVKCFCRCTLSSEATAWMSLKAIHSLFKTRFHFQLSCVKIILTFFNNPSGPAPHIWVLSELPFSEVQFNPMVYIFYSPISQITNLPSQSVRIRHPWPLTSHRIRKNSREIEKKTFRGEKREETFRRCTIFFYTNQ